MDADIAGTADQMMRDGPAESFGPPRSGDLATMTMGYIVCPGVVDHIVNVASVATEMVFASPPNASATKAFGNPIAFLFGDCRIVWSSTRLRSMAHANDRKVAVHNVHYLPRSEPR